MNALLVDREGDVWRVAGRTSEGAELLVCDSPQGPDDVGEPGPTVFPWTRRAVESWFGPLVPASPDAEVAELAAVDAEMHELFGRDESAWTLEQARTYLVRIDAVHARFEHTRAGAA